MSHSNSTYKACSAFNCRLAGNEERIAPSVALDIYCGYIKSRSLSSCFIVKVTPCFSQIYALLFSLVYILPFLSSSGIWALACKLFKSLISQLLKKARAVHHMHLNGVIYQHRKESSISCGIGWNDLVSVTPLVNLPPWWPALSLRTCNFFRLLIAALLHPIPSQDSGQLISLWFFDNKMMENSRTIWFQHSFDRLLCNASQEDVLV